MKEILLKYLRGEEKSISRLHRELAEEGIKVHRLVLTGYLKALADTGLLREKRIPPSKVYEISTNVPKDIYETVGEHARELFPNDERSIELTIYTLQNLFKRPIFLEELKSCGFEGPGDARQVSGEERTNARKVLSKTNMKVPYNDPCYATKKGFEEQYADILGRMVIKTMDARRYVAETKQVKLSF